MPIQIRPVILSGGSGTRLWPVSRKHFPKQFAPLLGEESLFDGTLKTVEDHTRFAPPLIVGNIEHRFLTLDALARAEISDARVLLEPLGRNTSAAIICAALAEQETQKAGEKILHLTLPSDHIIADKAAFAAAIAAARPAAERGKIVLFGIAPTRPETGFGYIQQGGETIDFGVRDIARFCEKPAHDAAVALIAQGALWNSGIFFYDPVTVLAEAERLMPQEVALCREALARAKLDMTGTILDKDTYARLGDQPFDRAIMEKTDKGVVVACDMGWNDLGSWQALWQARDKDQRGNAAIGSVVSRDIEGCYIHSYGPTVAIMGVTDMTVVATKDAVLIAPRQRAQDVRDIVGDLGGNNSVLALEHPRVMRPWGSYEGLAFGERFQVKHLIVKPGHSLSLQLHHRRAEHWVVVAGTALIICGDLQKTLTVDQSIYIPSETKHRLSNPGTTDLHVIEVQSGDYLGEDDIVRFEDIYGRMAVT